MPLGLQSNNATYRRATICADDGLNFARARERVSIALWRLLYRQTKWAYQATTSAKTTGACLLPQNQSIQVVFWVKNITTLYENTVLVNPPS